MSEVVQEAPQEFWQPPVVEALAAIAVPVPAMAEVCPRCGTEFLVGARFCHTCGGKRPEALSAAAKADAAAMAGVWEQFVASARTGMTGLMGRVDRFKFPAWMRYLHFHEIQRWVGLSTGSLVAFIIGISCIAGALLVGLLNAKTLLDWEAIQYYRGEWLLGATSAFVAGILLKKSPPPSDTE